MRGDNFLAVFLPFEVCPHERGLITWGVLSVPICINGNVLVLRHIVCIIMSRFYYLHVIQMSLLSLLNVIRILVYHNFFQMRNMMDTIMMNMMQYTLLVPDNSVMIGHNISFVVSRTSTHYWYLAILL